MSIYIRRYTADDAEAWDKLVEESWNGTFLHTRRFLSYHGDRFQDASFVIEDENKRIVGVFPAAIDPAMKERIVSHPGITYGGVVHNGSLHGIRMIEVLKSICEACRQLGFQVLRYKAVPHIYHRIPASDDLYALSCLPARRYRCDLAATVDLANRPPLASRRRRSLGKAKHRGVCVGQGACYLEPFWAILEEHLYSRYGVAPVHELREIRFLQSLFPQNIECVVGTLDGAVVAGMVIFQTHQLAHCQYSAASQKGYEVCATDLVADHCIANAMAAGKRYFDFGVSTDREGTCFNEGLYQFKIEFGAGGVVYEFYEIALQTLSTNCEIL